MAETYAQVSDDHTWRDPTGAWRVLFVLYVIAIVLYVALCGANLTVWAAYGRLVVFEPGVAAIFDRVVAIVRAAVLPIFALCAIATLVLTYRLVANAHARGASKGLTGPGMAVAAYFIPFVSLVMPPLVMGQLWRATFNAADGARGPGGRIAFWWAAFLIGNFTGAIVGASSHETPPPEQMRNLLALIAFSFLNRIIAASVLLFLFATLVKHQEPSTAAEVFD